MMWMSYQIWMKCGQVSHILNLFDWIELIETVTKFYPEPNMVLPPTIPHQTQGVVGSISQGVNQMTSKVKGGCDQLIDSFLCVIYYGWCAVTWLGVVSNVQQNVQNTMLNVANNVNLVPTQMNQVERIYFIECWFWW